MDRGAVFRNITIMIIAARIRQPVAAAIGQVRQAPVALDEFKDRGMVMVDMIDMARFGKRRHSD